MSAEVLREAAELMRARAEATRLEADWGRALSKLGRLTPKGQHAAGMSPEVAIALADWLDRVAHNASWAAIYDQYDDALPIANAYLGRTS